MEPDYATSYNTPRIPALIIDDKAKYFLQNAAKWAKFIAVAGFVGVGLFILLAFIIGPVLEEAAKSGDLQENPLKGMSSTFITIVYLIIALINFFPCLFLYRFATRIARAINNTDQSLLSSSLQQLKTFFKYIGGIIIILLALYGLIIIGVIAAVFFSH